MKGSARKTSRWARVRVAALATQVALASSTAAAADGAPTAGSLSWDALADTSSEDDGLPPDALEHLRRGAEYYKRGQYAQAEVEFARVGHFAPDWPPLHFNRAAAAEAQGKLNTAVESYEAYMPHADERQKMALELRIAELERRRDDGIKTARRQMVIAWSVFGGGLLVAGGGAAMIGVAYGMDEGQRRSRLLTGGYLLAVYGLIMGFAAGTPLIAIAHKNRRKVRGLAFTPIGAPQTVGGSLSARF
jgi:tetratricopeptide (TPR) repeat protein